jgi:hypothetical protein
LYNYAINNFLAETMNLFLQNRSVSSLVSAGENNFRFDPSKEYRMKIRIYEEDMDIYNGNKSFGPAMDDSLSLNGSRASHLPFLPPYDIGTDSQEEGVELIFNPTEGNHSVDFILNNLTESFTIYEDIGTQAGASFALDNRTKLTDSIQIDRKVKVGDSSRAIPSAPEYAISIQPKWESPVLDFSHRTASLSVSNTDAEISLLSQLPAKVTVGSTVSFKLGVVSGSLMTFTFTANGSGPANNTFEIGASTAEQTAINIQYALNNNNGKENILRDYFDISRSSETVTLTSKTPGEWTTFEVTQTDGGGPFDPLGITTTNGTGFIDNSSVSDNYYVGMWHQYGRIPTGSQGIKMQITEPIITDTTGSLAQALGFTNEPVKIGEIADRRTVKEAIVAIPYTIVEGEKRLFPINYAEFQLARFFVRNGGERPPVRDEYIDLARKGQEYVLPPKYDFFYNLERPDRPEGVSPFAMFVFDFNMKLNRQDLADIWQNLPPTSTSGKKDLTSGFDKEESIVNVAYGEAGSWFPEGLPADTRWMVFKVKQRAAYDYYEQVRDSSLAKGLRERVNVQGAFVDPTYSYNWPYDFFSFVELAKVDAAVDNNVVEIAEATTPRERAAEAAASGREEARERTTRSAAEDDATSGRPSDGVAASRTTGGGFFTGE